MTVPECFGCSTYLRKELVDSEALNHSVGVTVMHLLNGCRFPSEKFDDGQFFTIDVVDGVELMLDD